MKDGVRLLNFARGDLANSADVAAALESGKVAAYATDFADETILGAKNVIAMPHLGASTPESEDNCARMAALELIEYLDVYKRQASLCAGHRSRRRRAGPAAAAGRGIPARGGGRLRRLSLHRRRRRCLLYTSPPRCSTQPLSARVIAAAKR